jgi:hypothetical protein
MLRRCLAKVVVIGGAFGVRLSGEYPYTSFKTIFWALNYGIKKLFKINVKKFFTARGY